MLALRNRLLDVPVMSLQTGSELARTSDYIIDPHSLKIVALYVLDDQAADGPTILHVSDIREVSELGFIVDSSQVLMATDDLVRLQEIIDLNFEPINMPVFEESGKKLGKVSDFAFEPDSFVIQQLHTHQSFLRNITTASNIIGRQQIVAITADRIIVKSASISHVVKEKAGEAAQLVNPFRKPGQVEPAHLRPD